MAGQTVDETDKEKSRRLMSELDLLMASKGIGRGMLKGAMPPPPKGAMRPLPQGPQGPQGPPPKMRRRVPPRRNPGVPASLFQQPTRRPPQTMQPPLTMGRDPALSRIRASEEVEKPRVTRRRTRRGITGTRQY